MSVFRVNHETEYTVIQNKALRDNRLSLKAIGLLVKVFSLPPDWDFTEAGLATQCKDGLTAVRTALVELEENGYLIRTKVRDDKGRYTDAIYNFYENPQYDSPILENPILDTTHNKVKIDKIKINKVKTAGKPQLFDYVSNSSYKENIKEILTVWLREVGLIKIKGLSVNTLKKKVEEVITEVGEDNAYEVFKYSVMGGYPNFYTDRVKKNSNIKSNGSVPVNSTFMTRDEFNGAEEFI